VLSSLLDAAGLIVLLTIAWTIARFAGLTRFLLSDRRWAATALWLGLIYTGVDLYIEYATEWSVRQHILQSIRGGNQARLPSAGDTGVASPQLSTSTVPQAAAVAPHTAAPIRAEPGRPVDALRACLDNNGRQYPLAQGSPLCPDGRRPVRRDDSLR
jgi:hypothetical protein